MYDIKDYSYLKGIKGISDKLLENHFILYKGYVNNTNKFLSTLKQADKSSLEYFELIRRFAWEFNGMRLHELYFENLSINPISFDENSDFGKLIINQFSSFENFEKEFKSLTAIRGIGWVILVYDPMQKKLLNIWVNEHNSGLLVGTIPLLIIDVFEHSYMIDYGLNKMEYVNIIFKSIDWKIVEKRFKGNYE